MGSNPTFFFTQITCFFHSFALYLTTMSILHFLLLHLVCMHGDVRMVEIFIIAAIV